MQWSYAQVRRREIGQISLQEVFAFVSPEVRDAALAVARQLERLGVRHALAGGLAVGAHGYVRATTNVGFLVGEEAFEHHGSLVAFKPGVPVQVGTVRVDYLSPVALGEQLETTLDAPAVVDGMPVVPVEVLIYMKLVARRRRDQLDVVELLRAGADAVTTRRYLTTHAADQLPLFEELLLEAES